MGSHSIRCLHVYKGTLNLWPCNRGGVRRHEMTKYIDFLCQSCSNFPDMSTIRHIIKIRFISTKSFQLFQGYKKKCRCCVSFASRCIWHMWNCCNSFQVHFMRNEWLNGRFKPSIWHQGSRGQVYNCFKLRSHEQSFCATFRTPCSLCCQISVGL